MESPAFATAAYNAQQAAEVWAAQQQSLMGEMEAPYDPSTTYQPAQASQGEPLGHCWPILGSLWGSEGLSGEASWAAKPIRGGLLGSEGLSREASWAAKAYQWRSPG